LPLATDVVIAEAMAASGSRALDHRAYTVVVLPALPYSAAPFAAGFPGTLSCAPGTVTALILDLARELTRLGFAGLAIANAHLDPAHLGALAAAVAGGRDEKLLPIACPDLTRKPWALRLTDEFKSGACHAGRYESSIVLAARPELVRESVRTALPPNPASLAVAIRGGVETFEAAGGPRAYFGWPAEATAEEGRATIDLLGSILAESMTAELESAGAGR
jgi:creatinine amidohydrolase